MSPDLINLQVCCAMDGRGHVGELGVPPSGAGLYWGLGLGQSAGMLRPLTTEAAKRPGRTAVLKNSHLCSSGPGPRAGQEARQDRRPEKFAVSHLRLWPSEPLQAQPSRFRAETVTSGSSGCQRRRCEGATFSERRSCRASWPVLGPKPEVLGGHNAFRNKSENT